MVVVDGNGNFLVYIDLHITWNESITEVIRRWGTESSTSAGAEKEAGHIALKRLVGELDLHVKDVNYDDNIFHKLAQEYSFLKDFRFCYHTKKWASNWMHQDTPGHRGLSSSDKSTWSSSPSYGNSTVKSYVCPAGFTLMISEVRTFHRHFVPPGWLSDYWSQDILCASLCF